MLVELKNGETLNGHLVNCDTWMNLTLKEVVQTSPEGDRFFRLAEVYVRGNNVGTSIPRHESAHRISRRSNIFVCQRKSSRTCETSNRTKRVAAEVEGAIEVTVGAVVIEDVDRVGEGADVVEVGEVKVKVKDEMMKHRLCRYGVGETALPEVSTTWKRPD